MAANCSEGWTARGDFVYEHDPNAPCWINVPPVRGLYATGSALHGLAAIASVAYLRRLSALPHKSVSSSWLVGWLGLSTTVLLLALCCVRSVARGWHGVRCGSNHSLCGRGLVNVPPHIHRRLPPRGPRDQVLELRWIFAARQNVVHGGRSHAASQPTRDLLSRLHHLAFFNGSSNRTGNATVFDMYVVACTFFASMAAQMFIILVAFYATLGRLPAQIRLHATYSPPGPGRDQLERVAAKMDLASGRMWFTALGNAFVAAVWGTVPSFTRLSSYQVPCAFGIMLAVVVFLRLNTGVRQREATAESDADAAVATSSYNRYTVSKMVSAVAVGSSSRVSTRVREGLRGSCAGGARFSLPRSGEGRGCLTRAKHTKYVQRH